MGLLPLEELFSTLAKDKAAFPRMASDYDILYQNLVNHLRANIYKDIDAALAANSAKQGFYTNHNAEHFDEVVRYAGYLLKITTPRDEIKLSAYEMYVLLVAIRIHDAGNILGREAHEKKCFSILLNCGDAVGTDHAEKKIIANIAQAHGGMSGAGDRDTINYLPVQEYVGSCRIRSRLIAAIVRFADELCESRSRAANYLVQHGTLPEHSEIFHKYAAAISSNALEDNRVNLSFTIHFNDAIKPWGQGSKDNVQKGYLFDNILERLEKMNQERRYCNTFSRELYVIESIRATVKIVDGNHDTLEEIPIPELNDSGYPNEGTTFLRDKLQHYCGDGLKKRLSTDPSGAAA